MEHGFGQALPERHVQPTHRPVSRYLVLIASGEAPLARLFLPNFEQVGEFDATTEEVARMLQSLTPHIGASGAQWDAALMGHTAQERAAAQVYLLDA
jgi:hypothetical protein